MNIDPNTTAGMLSRRFEVIAFASAAVIFVTFTLAVLWISFSSEIRSFSDLTQRTSQQINEKVTLAIGTLHSMSAAHQASHTGFEPTQFEMFADNLVTNQTAITSAGRFEVLPHEDLALLKTELQLHGMFQFEPKGIGSDGAMTPLGIKPQYSTLIAFFPQNPVSAKYIGLDFSESSTTEAAINRSIEGNAPVPTNLPDHWYSSGQLNVFSSTYFGHYVPETVEDRKLQTDGGYFITLNIQEIVKQATGDEFPLSIGISLRSVQNAEFLVSERARKTEDRYGTAVFASKPVKHNLRVGADSATIVYRTPAGVTQSQLISALLTGLTFLILFLLAAAIVAATRASRAQILANEKALARERARALVTLNSLQDGVITTDPDDKVDYLNPAMLHVLGAEREQLIGTPLQSIIDENFKSEEGDRPNYDINKSNPDIASISSIKRLTDNPGGKSESAVFDCHSSAIVNKNHDKIGAVLTMRDISKEHALTTELAYQATHDALTGLPNRRKFENLLSGMLAEEDVGTHVVGYIDLDQFKLVNDTVGHAAGDELLKKVATDLEALAPEHIDVARLGGDEFGFLSIGRHSTVEIAHMFHEFFQSYFYQTEENIFSIRASIGLTTIKPYHITINDVLSEVDIACYTAKDAGRNSYVIYDAEDKETKERHGEMLYLPMLQTALKEDWFVLYTQPIVSTGKKSGDSAHHYECLIRMIDDSGNVITPYKFIVAAERYDLIRDIDRWVLENAFSQIANFKGSPLENTIFSINLSGQSAVDPSMPEFIDTMLNEYKIKSSNICFELTETAVISNFSQAQKLIAFVRNRGCTIALDDFGAGASSFGYLKNLEVDYLKIDGQFVKEITSNKVDLEMVRSMNSVGKALGIKTIAEFVENEEIMDALGEISVDYAQGYYVGKPMPMKDLLNDDNQSAAA